MFFLYCLYSTLRSFVSFFLCSYGSFYLFEYHNSDYLIVLPLRHQIYESLWFSEFIPWLLKHTCSVENITSSTMWIACGWQIPPAVCCSAHPLPFLFHLLASAPVMHHPSCFLCNDAVPWPVGPVMHSELIACWRTEPVLHCWIVGSHESQLAVSMLLW